MFWPRSRTAYEDADMNDLHVHRGDIPFVKKFKCLGSIVSSDLMNNLEVDARIKAAGAAFASASNLFFTSKQILLVNKKITNEEFSQQMFSTRAEANSVACVEAECQPNILWMAGRLDVKRLEHYLA
jgi:hypothetical protein